MAEMTPSQPWQADYLQSQRRRKLAEALMQNVMAPTQGQMIGRYYVGTGIGDGIAKLGQALLARNLNKQADASDMGAINAQQEAKQKAMDEFMGAVSPRNELDFNSIGDVTNGGALKYNSVNPSSRDIGLALLKAKGAGLEVDKDTASLLMGDNAPIEALGVVQTDQNGNVWNLNKRGQWNMAPFQAQKKTDYEPMRLNLEQKKLEALLEQMRQNRERTSTNDARDRAKEDAALTAPLAAVDRLIEIGSGKGGFYTGTVGDKAVYTSLGLGAGKPDAKFDNTRAMEQLETSLLLASKPPGMGAMSDSEWEMLKKGIPRRGDFPSAQSYLSAVRSYRSNLEAKIRAFQGQQPAAQPASDIDALSFFGQ